MSLDLFAGLRVREFAEARKWYERLLGEPTFLAHAEHPSRRGRPVGGGFTTAL
jgi:hypothetical protein